MGDYFMVPASKLLRWVCLIVLPCLAFIGLIPSVAVFSAVMICTFAMLILLDATLAFSSLDDIDAEFPAVQRLTKDQNGQLELHLQNNSTKAKRLRIGLPFPREIESENHIQFVMLPQGSEFSRLEWEVKPLKRGKYLIQKCYLEGDSPLGFWLVRKTVLLHTEIRVYPDLLAEKNVAAVLFLNRTGLGSHAQRQIGKGHEFEKLRKYEYGDSYDEIDWKATARRGYPVTRLFQVERTQEVYVIIDASRLSTRLSKRGDESNQVTLLERFVTASLIFDLAAEKQGDLFGLLTFSDKVQKFVPARNGKAHYNTCRDALYTLQPQILTPDFDELYTFIRLRLRRRALLVFLTSLDDPILAESFVRNIDLIAQQHLLFVNMIMPDNSRPLFSDPEISTTDEIYQNLGGHILWHNLRELEKVLKRHGVHFALLDNEKMSAQLVSHYINIKQRQIL